VNFTHVAHVSMYANISKVMICMFVQCIRITIPNLMSMYNENINSTHFKFMNLVFYGALKLNLQKFGAIYSILLVNEPQ